MKRMITAVAIAAVLGTPLAAQDARVSGTVAESFGNQVVVTTAEGRILVTLPDGTAVPATGTQLDLTGTRTGDVFVATAAEPVATITAPVPAAGGAVTLPPAVQRLGLTDVRTRRDDDGDIDVYGRLPDGGWVKVEVERDAIKEVKSESVGLPSAVISAVLPAAVMNEPRLAAMDRIVEIELDDDGEISVDGYSADGMQVELKFNRDGRLDEYKQERDDRRSMTEAAARDQLAALGYTDIAFVDRGGRHVSALAVNRFGDLVDVRLNEQGRVERERLWQR